MGLPVQTLPAVHQRRRKLTVFFRLGRHIKKALRPEEITSLRPKKSFRHLHHSAQFRYIVIGAESVIQRSALRIKPICHGNGFQQSGLPRSVLSHEECNVPRKIDPLYSRKRRDVPEIRISFDPRPVNVDASDKKIKKLAHGKLLYYLINLFNISRNPILLAERLQIHLIPDQHDLLKSTIIKPPESRHLLTGADAAAKDRALEGGVVRFRFRFLLF